MKNIKLASIASCLLLSTATFAADLKIASDLSISGDARVRGISTSGITAANEKDRETYDSRIRVNLDFKTESGIKIHSRIKMDNDTWGKNDNDKFEWDEGSILVPYKDFFLYAGRVNDTYGTKFYGSHNDKIDLAFIGYTGIENTLLYAFDYKAVEGEGYTDGGPLSTGNGDFDAYGIGGQVNVDKLLIGGRYVLLENKTPASDANDARSFFVDAFATGQVAGLELEAQVQKRGGDNGSDAGKTDSKELGLYLNIAKQFGPLKVGAIGVSTKDGYVSGGDLRASYLTSPTNGSIGTLGRVGAYGDTTLVAAQVKYDVTNNLNIEAGVASHSIKDATLEGFNKDLDIMEYNAGLSYKLGKNTTYKIEYAAGVFDQGNFEDIQNFAHSINVKF